MARYSLLSTYPPTRCGLATFSESFVTAITASGDDTVEVVRAIDDLDRPTPARINDSAVIVGELHVSRPGAVQAVSRQLSRADVVVVQHEYGIYGGDDGDDIIAVLESLTAPSIVVMHTVLEDPTPHQRRVLQRVASAANAVVVMSARARALLTTEYGVELDHVSVIPHGVPDWDHLVDSHRPDRTTMLTWGLIGPGKGLEWGIRAVAELRDVEPPVHYEILGETHPKVMAYEGDVYRERLQRLTHDLGIADRVSFDARYLDREQLSARVAAADLILLPYDSRVQVTSGVLVEAVAAGKPVVATGFPHALELLRDGAGTIVEHQSPASIAAAVRDIVALHDPRRRVAFDPGTAWSAVAQRYRELAASMTATIARSA
jgi:glycosyltransferase involved in cell wall biosynthesis